MSNVIHNSPANLPDKTPETVEKDVRKWVESICEFKANLDMDKCELPVKKVTKKIRKYKTKKKLSAHSIRADENKKHTKAEQKMTKTKSVLKKETVKGKTTKDTQATPLKAVFENLKDHYKSAKLPPNWVSGQSKGRLIFCRIKIISHGSQYEMVYDRGVAISADCLVHVFVDGPEIVLNNWKMQKVENIEDIRKTIKAVDSLKICSGALPSGLKSPSCSIFLSGDAKICQACQSDMSNLKISGTKVRANPKSTTKGSVPQK